MLELEFWHYGLMTCVVALAIGLLAKPKGPHRESFIFVMEPATRFFFIMGSILVGGALIGIGVIGNITGMF